jgi:hypothetical protein
MGQLLFTTEDMLGSAAELASAAGDLAAHIPRLFADAAVVMPPSLIAEAEATVATVAREVTSVCASYGANAVDLGRRVATISAVDAAQPTVAGLPSLDMLMPGLGGPFAVSGLSGVLAGLIARTPLGPAVARGALSVASDVNGNVFARVLKFAGDTHTTLQSAALLGFRADIKLWDHGKAPVSWLTKDVRIRRALDLPGERLLDKVALPLSLAESALAVKGEWDDTRGDTTHGRAVGALYTGTMDTAVDLIAPLGAADFVTGGAVSQAMGGDGQMLSRGVTGAERGYHEHGLAGAAAGFGSGVVQGGSDWRDAAETGKHGAVWKWVMHKEDKVIEWL